MASSKKGSTRSKRSNPAKAKTARPSVAKRLHKSAQKQMNAVGRGGAGQDKAGKTRAAATPRVSPPKAKSKSADVLERAGKAVRKAAKKVTSMLKPAARKQAAKTTTSPRSKPSASPAKARTIRRVSDVDVTKLDAMSGQASSKAPFDTKRSDAFAKHDIESALLNSNEEWGDEDHFTNRTGNKRIGTKGRKYE